MIDLIDPFNYSAAVASVQSGLSELLSEKDWNRLLAATSLPVALDALTATAYREAGTAENGRLGTVEKRLREAAARRFRFPMPFVRGRAYELIECLWCPYELNNLITVLRGLDHDVPCERIQADLVDLGPASEFDWQDLCDSRSISQLIDRLRKKPPGLFYTRALDDALNQYRRRKQPFVLEMALYLAHFRRLRHIIDTMSGRDRQEAESFVGAMIDHQNIVRTYRYRIFFRFEPETILAYSLPTGTRVDAAVLQRAAAGARLEKVVRSIWESDLPDLDRIADRPEDEALVELEILFRRLLYDRANRLLDGYPVHLGVLLAWTVLLEVEVEDLITVLEGISHGWSPENIRAGLIAPRGRP